MNVAVILAGGVGNRLGAGIPKQFVEVLGRPVLAWTVEKFQEHREIDAVEIVCIESYIPYMEEMKDRYGLDKIKWIARGGATFQESVMNGIYHLEDKLADDDIVLVHFAANPFVEEEIITDAIRVCRLRGNAITTTPFYVLSGLKDDETKCSTWIDRDSIAVMNAPHAFRYGYIRDLYKEAVATGAIHEVEPHTTTLMWHMGQTVYFSYGSQTNLKITTREDLDLFEGYLLMKQKRREERETKNARQNDSNTETPPEAGAGD